jgi:PAS domain S-box-containing protein
MIAKASPARALSLRAEYEKTDSQGAMRNSQQTLFVEQVPAAIAMFDAEMHYMAVSRRYLSDMASLFSTGVFAPVDVIGRSHYELFPGIPLRWRSIHARVLAGEELAQQEHFIRRADRPAWARWLMKPWRAADGQLGGALLFFETITAEVEARRALAECEERLRATFENAAVGIAHVDSTLRHIRANNALSGIVGWPLEEFITKSVGDVTHPDDLADDLDHIEQMLRRKIDSYDFEKRYLRKDGSITWARVTTSCVRRRNGSVNYFVRFIQDISDRKRGEEQVHLLMREANHRAKNMLSLVQVIARQTAAGNPEDFVDRFTERLQALAANQDLLVRHKWQGIDVDDLVRAQLAPFADLIGPRIIIRGQKLRLNAAAAQAIGLALHELATNASKYGALSTYTGRVDIRWEVTDDDTFTMDWTERDGPPVSPPQRRGFGTTVAEAMAESSVGGSVDLDYAPSGVTWRLTCPVAKAMER